MGGLESGGRSIFYFFNAFVNAASSILTENAKTQPKPLYTYNLNKCYFNLNGDYFAK